MREAFSKSKDSHLTMDDLALVTYRLKKQKAKLNATFHDWCQTQPLMSMESCARQVLLGFASTVDIAYAEQFATDNPEGEIEILKGRDAYLFALKLVCGLLTRDAADTHVKNQFFSQFDDFQNAHGKTLGAPLNRVLSDLRKDAKRIHKEHLQELVVPNTAPLLRRMIGEDIKTNTLVIACEMRNRKLPDIAERILSTFGTNGKNKFREIVILPIGPYERPLMKSIIAAEVRRLSVTSMVNLLQPDCVEEAFATSNVFMTAVPMGTRFDQSLEALVMHEGCADQTLFHLGRNPGFEREKISTNSWLSTQNNSDSRLFLIEDIQDRVQTCKDRNNVIFDEAVAKAIELASCRADKVRESLAFKKR